MEKFDHSRLLRLGLAFLLAVLFWYFVNGDTSSIVSETINDIPVTLVNTESLTDRGLTLKDNLSYYVNLQVQGTERSLREISVSEITAEVNLEDIYDAGTYEETVVIKGLANTVIINRVTPENLTIDVERIEDKEWEPEILTEGKPGGNEHVISTSTDTKVTLSGSTSQLAKVASVSGVANVNGITEDAFQTVEVFPYDEEGNIVEDVEVTPSAVFTEIVLGVTKEVPISTPVIVGSADTGYQVTDVTVEPKSVTIAGSEEKLSEVTSVELQSISLSSNSTTSSFKIDDKIIVPNGIILVGDTTTATVNVTIEQKSEKKYTIETIDPVNLASGLKVSKINTSSISIKVSGVSSDFTKIDASSLKATIDLSGKTAGTYTVPVSITIPAGSIETITPTDIEVTIVEGS